MTKYITKYMTKYINKCILYKNKNTLFAICNFFYEESLVKKDLSSIEVDLLSILIILLGLLDYVFFSGMIIYEWYKYNIINTIN